MFSCCLPNGLGLGRKSLRSEGLVAKQTGWGSRQSRRLGHTGPSIDPKGRKESSPKLEEAGRVGSLEPGTLKKLVSHLVPAHRRGDPFFVPAFLAAYRRFATPRQVLDLLLLRYRSFRPDSEEDQQNKSALSSILQTWLLQYPGDFGQCPDPASLKQLVAYALLNLPDSDIILHVCTLPTRLRAG